MSVALAYVHGEFVTSYFMETILGVVEFDRNNDHRIRAVIPQRCTTIALGRNRVVERFLAQEELDWLWFVDTDMTIEPNTLSRMLDGVDGPAVVAAECWRHDARKGSVSALRWSGNGSAELEGCGMACTLIHRRVLEDVRAAVRDDPWPWFGHDLVDGQRLSEDLTFCRRATSAGHRLLGLTGVLANHFKLQALVPPGSRWVPPGA